MKANELSGQSTPRVVARKPKLGKTLDRNHILECCAVLPKVRTCKVNEQTKKIRYAHFKKKNSLVFVERPIIQRKKPT